MPSGSHGGGGGSHFSGGSSFGGFRGGSSGGSGRGPRGPMRFHFGNNYYVVSGGRANFLSFIFALLFILVGTIIASAGFMKDAKYDLRKIEVDREYYLDMIEYAESHPEYLVDGVVTDKYYKEFCDRWYFTYAISYGAGETLEGYTYCVYDNEQIKSIRIGDVMQFAVNSNPISASTDSINVGYKEIPLENDGEYIKCKKSISRCTIAIIVSSTLIAGCIAIAVCIVLKSKQKEEAKVAEEKAKEQKEEARLNRHCPYCSGKLDPDAKKCPNCGASLE